ncbi:MAG: hypothetical protein M1376_00590 [Planctomycetes bacterium]|nr:hypothetical protein [Planctomycetota bacterium]
MQRRMVKIGVVACVLGLMVGGLSLAQQGGGNQGGGRRGGQGGGPGGGPGGFDPAQMRQRMAERMKEMLGADDQAWKVMEPRLMKVMELNRQANAGGRGMMFGMFGRGRGGPGGPGGDQGPQAERRGRGPQGEQTALEKAMTQLRTTLENQSATSEEIKTQLTAVRSAREKARQELAVAQQELKKILTLRQEAMLVEMGMLE